MKQTNKILILVIAVLFFCAASCMASSGHNREQNKKMGILLVAFGSSEASAQISFENIDARVKARYPGIPVQWAYTSHMIRTKLARQGKYLDSPEVALAKMMDQKFTHVAVQSLHTILGAEYDDLKKTIDAYKIMGGFQNILLGYPLMATQADMERTVDAVFAIIPKERKKDEAVVLMGHGSHHPANAFYAALMFQLQLKDPHIFVGTVEGYPDVGLIQGLIQKKNLKTVWLMPLMSVAGDHAKNDMAGDEADSWKTIFTASGIHCIPVLKGTAEHDVFVDIWVDHIAGSLQHFMGEK